MLAARYTTKAALKAAVGKELNYTETSMMGNEFKRGWRSQWSYYRKDGKFREFDSWNDAYAFLLEKCHGNAAFLSLHFCGADPLPERETPVTPDKDLFGALCDAYARIKDSLDPQQ